MESKGTRVFSKGYIGVLHSHAKVPFTHLEKTVEEDDRAGNAEEKDGYNLE